MRDGVVIEERGLLSRNPSMKKQRWCPLLAVWDVYWVKRGWCKKRRYSSDYSQDEITQRPSRSLIREDVENERSGEKTPLILAPSGAAVRIF